MQDLDIHRLNEAHRAVNGSGHLSGQKQWFTTVEKTTSHQWAIWSKKNCIIGIWACTFIKSIPQTSLSLWLVYTWSLSLNKGDPAKTDKKQWSSKKPSWANDEGQPRTLEKGDKHKQARTLVHFCMKPHPSRNMSAANPCWEATLGPHKLINIRKYSNKSILSHVKWCICHWLWRLQSFFSYMDHYKYSPSMFCSWNGNSE